MKKTILMKPHHFLDIIKLYGAGYEKFVSDKENGHDFWKVGNEILGNPNIQMKLTIDNDAICAPCKSNDGKVCVGMTMVNSGEMSKDGFNKMIDKRILEKLNLKIGSVISAIEYCRLAKDKLSQDDIYEVWSEKPIEETKRRIELLFAGIDKYLSKFAKLYDKKS